MPNFIVTVRRTAHGFRDLLVEGAANDKEARRVAEENAGNFEFSEKTSEYAIEGVIALEPNAPIAGSLETIKVK